LGLLALVLFSLFFWMLLFGFLIALDQEWDDADEYGHYDDEAYSYAHEFIKTSESGGSCNTALIPLYGFLATTPNNGYEAEYGSGTNSKTLLRAIEDAERDESIAAIVLEVDSWGGMNVADEEVERALKRALKPTVALIRASGVSAAYFAATGADKIFASRDSEVGGIGVSASYIENVSANEQSGYTFRNLSVGALKEAGNPDKELTAGEREMILRNAQDLYDTFVETVAHNRGLPEDDVRALADGGTMMGARAFENGLIDEIGGFYEVKEYLQGRLGQPVTWCDYEIAPVSSY